MTEMNNSLYFQSHTYSNGRKQKSYPIIGQGLKEIDKGFSRIQEKIFKLYIWVKKQMNFVKLFRDDSKQDESHVLKVLKVT